MLKERKKLISNFLFILEILLFIILSFFFFPGNDEMDFVNLMSFSGIKEFLHNIYYFGNGRFLGNAIGVFFSFHQQWYYFMESIIVAAICVLCEKITNVKYARHYAFAFILFQPIWSFSESIVRLATFTNYYIPILLSLISLLILKNIYKKNKKPNAFLLLVIFVIGICEQLFVESNTIINIVLIFFIIIYLIALKKNIVAPAVLFVGNIIGAGIILLYSFYVDYTKTVTYQMSPEYRDSLLSIPFTERLRTLVNNVRYPVFYLSVFIFFFVSITAASIYVSRKKGSTKKQKALLIISIAAFIPLCIITGAVCYKYSYNFHMLENNKNFILIFSAIVLLFAVSYLSAFSALYLIVIKNSKYKIQILFCFVMGILSFAPFLIVSPCGLRCCQLMMIFFMFSMVYVGKEIVHNYGVDFFQPVVICSTLCCIVLVVYSVLYYNQKKINNYRFEYFKTSDYLPLVDPNLAAGGDLAYKWDNMAGREHTYVTLEEFEKLLEEGKITK